MVVSYSAKHWLDETGEITLTMYLQGKHWQME